MAEIPSEGPYSRLGAADATVDQRKRLYRLHGGEHVFGVAHITLGEWREWRKVCDENNIADPLNLRGYDTETAADAGEVVVDIEADAEDGSTEAENFSTDLDRYYTLDYQTPELEGTGSIQITDLEGGDYVVGEDFGMQFKAPGEASYGEVAAFNVLDMQDATKTSAVPHTVFMLSNSQQYAIAFTCDADTFLMLWLLREFEIEFDPLEPITRDFLVVPTLELPRGRGET